MVDGMCTSSKLSIAVHSFIHDHIYTHSLQDFNLHGCLTISVVLQDIQIVFIMLADVCFGFTSVRCYVHMA